MAVHIVKWHIGGYGTLSSEVRHVHVVLLLEKWHKCTCGIPDKKMAHRYM